MSLAIGDAPIGSSDALRQAASLEDQGDLAAAVRACDAAIASWPDIGEAYRFRLHLARRLGDRASELATLETLVRHEAPGGDALAPLSELLFEKRRFDQVVALLRPYAGQFAVQVDLLNRYVVSLAEIGAYREIIGLRALVGETVSSSSTLAYLAMATLALHTEREPFLAGAALIERSPRWRAAEDDLSMIAAAISAGRPFSMISIEKRISVFASMIGRSAKTLLAPEQRSAVLDGLWTEWLGASPAAHSMAAIETAFHRAIESADLVAMPDAASIAADALQFGCLAASHRAIRFATDADFTDVDAVFRMHALAPYLRTVLADLSFLAFIGGQPAMFRKLAHFCGVANTSFVQVPLEARYPVAEDGLDPRDFASEGHARLLAELGVPFPGAVFLISAPGPFGVICAGRIKALGGIALDIGSLTLKWAGG